MPSVLVGENPLWLWGFPDNDQDTGVCIIIMDDIEGIKDLNEYQDLKYICEHMGEEGKSEIFIYLLKDTLSCGYNAIAIYGHASPSLAPLLTE